MHATPLLFAPVATRVFAERMASSLGFELAPLEEREFEGGEHKTRPLVSVRGRSVYLVQALSGDAVASANDRLCRTLFLIAGLKDAGAARVTACLPYLAYARKDRRTKERDPVNSRYVAQLFEAVRVDHVVTMDVHNIAAFENAFRCTVDLLEAAPLLAQHIVEAATGEPLSIVSPDIGGAKRAQRIQELVAVRRPLDVELAVFEKRRSSGVVSGELLVGPVAGRHVVIVDDLIAAGTTVLRATAACRAAGALSVTAFATHGVFAPGSERLLGPAGPDRLIVTDTLLPTRLQPTPGDERTLEVLPASAMFAEAVRRLESGESVVALREMEHKPLQD
ncbi:MAG TPA: ribose-phosphate diphosphokinase [Steroidobacteraceae bacterium]|nr:ribose-phosphate diphosphokinase [Steroidobacteraceae bacterium]